MTDLNIHFVDSIAEIGRDAWNAISGTDNPFLRYEFLWTLEDTGCTTERSGWRPRHVLVRRSSPDNSPVAVMPLYVKNNSWGEYVFDWSWANAYQQYGLNYYPKLVTSVPFTPSSDRRILCLPGESEAEITELVVQAVREQANLLGASGWHVLFPTAAEHDRLQDNGLLARIACQFHWFNQGYASFDDFLTNLSSRKRKNLKKERSRVAQEGISFRRLEGAEITEVCWQEFYTFYQSTYLMRGMQGYLSQEFFMRLAERMPEQLLLVCAEQAGKMIAAALFFRSSCTLYGRYWGSASDYQFLHFETCYYQGQDYAIEHGLQRFDSGAQGEHKIQRGFEPITTFSNHWLARGEFSRAIADFLAEERRHILTYQEQARSLLPYRNEQN